MTCCDTCPRSPTCEEENDFLADIGLGEPWGDDGCDCCGDGDD